MDFQWKKIAASQKVSTGLSKLRSACPHEQFEEFFQEKCILLSFSDVVGELFDLFRKSIGGVVKFCNYVSINLFEEKIFPSKWSFSKQAEVQRKFFDNCRINSGRAVKIAFRVPIRNIFKKNTVSEKESFSSQFCKSGEKVFAFYWSFLGWGCQNCLLRVHWNVLRDLILPTYFLSFLIPDTELKSSCILWKIFRQNCQNCIPCVHGEKLGWIFSIQIYCFSSFLENEPKNFGLSTNFSRQIFENYILRVHKNNLRTFFAKKTNIHQFWNLKEKDYAFFPKSNGGVVKTAFYLSTGTFRGVFFRKKY